MLTHGVSHLVVIEPESERPVGILSTLDIAGVLAWGEAEPVRRKGRHPVPAAPPLQPRTSTSSIAPVSHRGAPDSQISASSSRG